MRIVGWQTIPMKYIPYFFFRKSGKMLQNLSSAAVVIGALRVNITLTSLFYRRSAVRLKWYGYVY